MNLESDIIEHLITTSRCFGLKLHQSELKGIFNGLINVIKCTNKRIIFFKSWGEQYW
jgi:hypothetical protein